MAATYWGPTLSPLCMCTHPKRHISAVNSWITDMSRGTVASAVPLALEMAVGLARLATLTMRNTL